MSVLIKSMEKPKNCIWRDGMCPLLGDDDDCKLQDCQEEWTWQDQYKGCPLSDAPDTNVDTISRQAAIDEIEYELEMINSALDSITLDFNARERLRQRRGEAREILNSIQQLPSAQQDAVTASLEELINDYGEDGYFIVDGVNYQANELLNELKINSSVGEKFRKQIVKTIVQYFMKFGG